VSLQELYCENPKSLLSFLPDHSIPVIICSLYIDLLKLFRWCCKPS